MARTTLRAVRDNEKAPIPRKPRPKSITVAAASGTTRELLAAMRQRIAVAVEDPNTPARDLAALTKRLVEVVKEIDAIDAISKQESEENGTSADEAFDSSAI
jgi:hypothetical protein